MPNLIGVHDIEGFAITPDDTWILDTIALSESDAGKSYNPTKNWLVRVNWGYGSTGTIPLPADDSTFLARLANYVAKSDGNRRWIIGNEPNLPREWPQGQPIHPSRYAEFFKKCRQTIKDISGHEEDEVLIAASGPWNNEYKYAGNSSGDWISYFTSQQVFVGEGFDGFSIHSYTHGYNTSLVTSEDFMDAPFQNRHYNFRTYQDYCNAILAPLAHLPTYLTEANGDGPWHAVGLMPEMAREIDSWNKSQTDRKIFCLIFYRYPKYDQYHMEGKEDVLREYQATVALGFQTPSQPQQPEKILLPAVKNYPPKKGKITASQLNVRNRPSLSGSTIIGHRWLGEVVEIFEQVEGWYRIGSNHWVSNQWVENIEENQAPVPIPFPDPEKEQSCWGKAIRFVLKEEGGYVDHPNDPGGATNKGITIDTYRRWRASHNQPAPSKEDLKNITDAEIYAIYYQWYWLASNSDKLSWPLCLINFDTAVNAGVGKAKEMLDKSDGRFLVYAGNLIDWYTRIDNFNIFGKGWTRRRARLLIEASK